MRTLLVPSLLFLLPACGFVDAEGDPIYEAHRGASGMWPQNSRQALTNSVREGFDAIEFDVVLTSDGVPIISHDPWFHDPLCTHADGSDIAEDVRIDTLTLEETQNDFLCGGKIEEEFPDVEPFAEPPMTVEELFTFLALEAQPELLVHIDIKYEPGLTPPPEDFAAAVMPLWVDSGVDNDFYVSANTPEATIAFERWGDDNDLDIPTSLIWPTFPPNSNTTAIGLGNEFGSALGTVDLVQVIREAEADGIGATHQIIDRRQIEDVVRHGYFASLWTVNDPDLMAAYSKFPLRSLITDYPERGQ